MSLTVVCCLSCALVCALGTVECWGGRQGGCGPELCGRRLRVCGSQLAVCLVSLFVSVCRSCVSSSSVLRPPIPRWCPVRAWLFFTLLPMYVGREVMRSQLARRAVRRYERLGGWSGACLRRQAGPRPPPTGAWRWRRAGRTPCRVRSCSYLPYLWETKKEIMGRVKVGYYTN